MPQDLVRGDFKFERVKAVLKSNLEKKVLTESASAVLCSNVLSPPVMTTSLTFEQ